MKIPRWFLKMYAKSNDVPEHVCELRITAKDLRKLFRKASGQYRIVELNSTQVQGQEPRADAILVAWEVPSISRIQYVIVLKKLVT